MQNDYDVVVIGGGPAGLAAAIKAKEYGLRVLVIENRETLGGIPLQCVHPGFGLHYFKEDLTGTEFIYRFINKFLEMGIEYHTGAHVVSIEPFSDLEKRLTVVTSKGVLEITTTTIIYATGARERHPFEIGITGHRPAGVYTAGEAQTMMDIDGIMPGKEIVIVGSGDVGLIMARRFALEGAHVKAVIEIMPYPGGLMRNIVQCLQDFGIPLYLSHAVTRIEGTKRVEKVIIAKVDENLKPIPGTEEEISCDTVIIAAGLVPYLKVLEKAGVIIDPATRGPVVNEYLETSIPGVFVAGNALVINDLVDYVVEQGELAAKGAYLYVQNKGIPTKKWKRIVKGRNIRLVTPHYISGDNDVVLYARVQKPEEKVKLRFPEIDKEIKLPFVRPAEMLRIKLKKEELARAKDKITMEVVPHE
ncbi:MULTISPECIES: NAD(P)/FAD-dependent oxidoreductase [Thermococcus]|jgi:NADPH-dependent 2,4-dienoyl-CoA reductase/sulfur reductase-like enzyme|uniref:Sarcosine oxidase alpha subunit n=1 Tax=Thermococcus sibiricus TaxID=172049 RepID=A0A101EKE1_9EURY|nr:MULTISPECIES: FAD-dependent oxidoreductase [Thermococcus]KUK16966.1 MAG: Sarcosine oxidase alpha subunit [Thermococcus sibiricus]MCA6214163.1 FAD-dependent oxidoreductase [Thermococcus bergensis]